MAVPSPAVTAPAPAGDPDSRVAPAHLVLAAIVVVSAVARLVASYPRATPRYLPDEFLYTELARSIGRGDGISVLGQPTSFPALLEPLLTAPFWTAADAETSIHLTQAFHSVAMALAAMPVYMLARRLSLSNAAALACAAATVVAPGLLYASYMTADASATCSHSSPSSRPSARSHARPWRRRPGSSSPQGSPRSRGSSTPFSSPPSWARHSSSSAGTSCGRCGRFAVVAAAVAAACVPAAVLGSRVLGRYEAVTEFGVSQSTGGWVVSTAALLAVVAGAALVPGAAAWITTSFAGRGTDRARTGFAALTGLCSLGLVVASAVMSVDTGSDRFLERYLIGAFPLVAIAFCCWADDGRPGRFVAIGVAALVIVAAARVPVSGQLIGQGSADSPTLLAAEQARRHPRPGGGEHGRGPRRLCVRRCSRWQRRMSRRVPTSALIGVTLRSSPSWRQVRTSPTCAPRERAHRATFGGDSGWIEAEHPGDVLLVQTPGSSPYSAEVTALSNPSIRRAVPLGQRDILEFDGLGKDALTIAARRDADRGRPPGDSATRVRHRWHRDASGATRTDRPRPLLHPRRASRGQCAWRASPRVSAPRERSPRRVA